MTRLKDPNPRIVCFEMKCYEPNSPNIIKIEEEVTPHLDNDKELMHKKPL
jgi:hypothetical protein